MFCEYSRGIHISGLPDFFIRLTGCHLRCRYCDTTYAFHEGRLLSVDELIQMATEAAIPYVCVTGGEPLLQPGTVELLRRLCDQGFRVSLETSGAKSIEAVDPRVKVILDIKTPGSGEAHRNFWDNLKVLNKQGEIKFVVAETSDWPWILEICDRFQILERWTVLISPAYGQVSTLWLAEQIIASKKPFKLQVQLHKVIWPDKSRGV